MIWRLEETYIPMCIENDAHGLTRAGENLLEKIKGCFPDVQAYLVKENEELER